MPIEDSLKKRIVQLLVESLPIRLVAKWVIRC